MNITKLIQENIIKAVKENFDHVVENVEVEHPANEEHGDYSSNIAMKLAKVLRRSPKEIAEALTYSLNEYDLMFDFQEQKAPIFDSISYAHPGFINFVLSKHWLHQNLFSILSEKSEYGSVQQQNQQKIALEHSNVNPNKAAHVGHLRNACIGQFLERTYEFLGHDVEVQYYDNDLGVQVTTSLMGIDYVKDVIPEGYKKFDHYAWDVYSKMESYIKENTALEKQRQSLMAQLEDSTTKVSQEQDQLAQKILKEQLKTFIELDFDYDVVVRERDIVNLKFWEQTFKILKQNPNVYLATEGESKGCWLIKMGESEESKKSQQNKNDAESAVNEDTDGIEIEKDKILVRSNGVPTYTGKDIAYHLWKFGLLGKDFEYSTLEDIPQQKPLYITASASKKDGVAESTSENKKPVSFSNAGAVLNVIDGRQSYAMEAVKQALLSLGYQDQAQNMVHVNYGFVYLSYETAKSLGIDTSDNKDRYAMSGRKGWGIKIDDFIDLVDHNLKSLYGDFESIKHVRNGAIKFEMLKVNTFQDMVFDLEDALSIKGYSGPYIQYTHARAHSILQKGDLEFDSNLFSYEFSNILDLECTDEELAILRHLHKFSESLHISARDYAPNILCTYLFELAQKFNVFYNNVSILGSKTEADKNFRLILTGCTKQILQNGLNLLGITSPNKM